MKHSWKRVLSAVLTLVMIASLLVVPTSAAEIGTSWDFKTLTPEADSGKENYAQNDPLPETPTGYDGLTLHNVKYHSTGYGTTMGSDGSIDIAVPGDCDIQVGVGYEWHIQLGDDASTLETNPDNGNTTVTFHYKGEAGTATIKSMGTSYISGITLATATTPAASLSVDKDNVKVKVGGEAATVNATVKNGGDAAVTWDAETANSAVATAACDNGVVTITPAGEGTTTVAVKATVGDATDPLTATIAVTVEAAGPSVVAAGTYYFSDKEHQGNKGTKQAWDAVTGVEFTSGFTADASGHGPQAASGGTMTVSIPEGKFSTLVVTTCTYGGGGDVTASSGTVTEKTGAAAQSDGDAAKQITVTNATGTTTITFSGNTYVHGLTVGEITEQAVTPDPEVSVDQAEVVAKVGTTTDVNATVANGTATAWTATSDNDNVATALAGETGVVTVTPVAAGKATITVKATVEGTEYPAQFDVYVAPATVGVLADGTYNFMVLSGETTNDGKLIFNTATPGMEWTDIAMGQNPDHGAYGKNGGSVKVYVPDGKVADLEVGTCQYGAGASITATSGTVGTAQGTDPVTPITGVSGEATITFGSQVYVHSVKVTLRDANSASLTVDPTSVTMREGESKDVTITAQNYADTFKPFAISGDTAKATVALADDGAKATITGVAEGTATVYIGMAETAPADATAAAAVEGVVSVSVTVTPGLAEGTKEWVWGGSDGSHSKATFDADCAGLKLPEGNELKDENGNVTGRAAIDYHNNYGILAKPKMAADGTTIEVPATIGIPVDGPSTITVKVGYTWDIMLGDAQDPARYGRESATSGNNGSEQAKVFNYYGNAGFVTLTATEATSTYIYSIMVEPKAGATAVPKVAVWDLNATQLDETLFDNRLDVDTINGFYGDPIPEPPTLGSFATADGEFAFVAEPKGDGVRNDYRLRTGNPDLLVHSTNNHTKNDIKAGEDPYDPNLTAYGVSFQSNGGVMTFKFKANAGDKLTFTYADASTTGATINMNYIDAADADKEGDAQITKTLSKTGEGNGSVTSVYVAATGIQTFTNVTDPETGLSVGKVGVSRFYRETPTKVTISGNLTVGQDVPAGYKLVATDNASGAVYEAAVNGGTYSVEVNNYLSGTDFTFSVEDALGVIVGSGAEVSVPAGATAVSNDVAVIKVDLVTVSGSVTGLGDDLADLVLEVGIPSDKIYVPKIIPGSDGTYTTQLEKDVAYTLTAKNVNDYTLTTTALNKSADETGVAIAFDKKALQTVTITADPDTVDLTAAKFTFTNFSETDDAHPDGYVYTFTGNADIKLRDGQYKVKVEGTSASPKLISDLKVNGAAATKVIPFQVETPTKWVFTAATFTSDVLAAKNFNGLLLDGTVAREEKDHAILRDTGKMSIPVSGPCRIDVTVYYESNAAIGADNTPVVLVEGDPAYHTTGTKQTFSYDYTGAAGYVDLTATGTTYVTEIEVVEVAPYKATLTVGADKDYQTVQAAVDAATKMERPNNERVTIMIDPGNYEEMVWVRTPNITFKNAAANPSIALKNQGKDIDATGVRITWYYGCGFDYYSMGPNSKFNAEQFAVNKENGYVSHPNSAGGGSNNECWWNATTVIAAEGFEAEGIIFENSFNQYVSAAAAADTIVPNDGAKQDDSKPRASLPEGSTEVQRKAYVERAAAIALANDVADKAVFTNCAFVGHQDVIYGGRGVNAAFYDCDVMGACDYIFGPMAAVFAKCDLILNVGADSDANDVAYITAPQNGAGVRGYLMWNCNVRSVEPGVENAGTAKTAVQHAFGRAWGGATAECAFYETTVGVNANGQSLIGPEGWNTGLGSSKNCAEYHTHDEAANVDYSQRIFGGVLDYRKLEDGTKLDCETWLGDWKPFEGKDMTVVCPGGHDEVYPESITVADDKGNTATELRSSADATEIQLTATVVPSTATVEWTSSSETVTVDATGKVTVPADAAAEEVTITASAGKDEFGDDVAATYTITIKSSINTGSDNGGNGGVIVIKGDGAKSETVINEDGSKTTTTTDKDGNKTIVTEMPDGAKTEIISKVDGEKTITVTDASGEEIVKVEVPATVPAPEAPFVDVPEDHWAKEAIDTMAGLGLVNGVDAVNHVYDMNSSVTRGALASILYRFSNGKEGLTSDFADVLAGAWYTDGVAWAAKVGVVNGYGDGTFGPDNTITRQELAVMLYRYAKLIGMDTGVKAELTRFNDSDAVATWAKDAMTWCTEAGIIKGVGGNTLNPEGVASRAECAVMLSRFIDLV